MKEQFINTILEATNASSIIKKELIQSLWSGYGEILRIYLKGGKHTSVVVKHVKLPEQNDHPRGWNTDLGHERKLKSYRVETAFYRQYSAECNEACRIPHCLAFDRAEEEVLIVLEDLNAAGFDARKSSVSWTEIDACLIWLANFHATFLQQNPQDLWEVGTYWHLDTRPEELRIINDQALKKAAPAIDQMLRNSPYQTFVHGDAKLANFCFSQDGKKVAAVDFQYVGGGCGMKDVAYFIGSCLYEEDCEQLEDQLLNHYFKALRKALAEHQLDINADDLEANWREMYPLAWTDFHRFLKGWSPDHWKINSYSERMAREVLATLNDQ